VLFSLSSRPTRLRRGSLGDSFRLAHNTVHLPKPPPDGRGSVTVALIEQRLLSRAQRAPRKRAGAFPKTFKHPPFGVNAFGANGTVRQRSAASRS
jgi:hypothetical protein